MASANAVFEFSGAPPEEAAYHLILLPVTTMLARVGFDEEQNVWDASPVGVATVAMTEVVTFNLDELSQPLRVCEA